MDMKKYITLVESAAKPLEVKAKPVQPKTEPAPLVHISESYESSAAIRKIVRNIMEKKSPPQPPKQRNPVAKNANAAVGGGAAGKHKDKKKDAKQGVQKHKGQQLDEDDTGSTDKGEFKRRELEHELGHETRSGSVYIDGKYWKTFDDYKQAQNVARSLERKGKRATVRIHESKKPKKTAQEKLSAAVDKERKKNEPATKRAKQELDAIMPSSKKASPVSEKMRTPFAGAAVGHKEGPAGQLKAMDPKGYPKGKLVGGALEEGRVCPQCGSSKCSCPPGKCKCKPVAGFKPKMKEDKDPCWDNYKMVGTKKKGSKTVPNCVPKESKVGEAQNAAQQAAIAIAKKKKKDVAEGLNEFAPDGFGGDDGDGFDPDMAKMAHEEGFTKGISLAMVATLERAMEIGHWHKRHGGMYKHYFAKGFKEGRLARIRHDNKQYDLNLQLNKDGSVSHGEQDMAEGFPHDVDHMPGKTVKHQDTNCTTCHGRKSMYKLGGKLFSNNKPGAAKVKCPSCRGTGEKKAVAEDMRTKADFRKETGDAVSDFLNKGGKIKEVPPNKVRVKPGQSLASKHIGSKSEAGRVVGKDRKINSKQPVVSTEHMGETQLDELDRPSGKLYIIITADNAGAPHVFGDFGSFPQDVMHKIAKRGTRDKSGAKTKLKIDFLFDDFRSTIQQLRTIFRDLDFIGAEAAEFIIKSSALRSDQGEEVKHLRDYIQAGDDRRMKMYQAPEDDEEEGEPTGGNILRIDPETGAARRVVGVKPQTQMGGKSTEQPGMTSYKFKDPRFAKELRGMNMGFNIKGDTITVDQKQKVKLVSMLGDKFGQVFTGKELFKEGGEKYKIKSTGSDINPATGKRADYYISPSTGKKVYKKAKVGDHENPNSGEHKPKVEGRLSQAIMKEFGLK